MSDLFMVPVIAGPPILAVLIGAIGGTYMVRMDHFGDWKSRHRCKKCGDISNYRTITCRECGAERQFDRVMCRAVGFTGWEFKDDKQKERFEKAMKDIASEAKRLNLE